MGKTKRLQKLSFIFRRKVWAWKEGRVKKMKQCIDKMLVILPFEKDYYKNKWNWDVEYVGHPLVEVIDSFIESEKSKVKSQNDKPTIALLPGSRKQEISKEASYNVRSCKTFSQL
jgi:lipid-A-disaccharide synthase